MRPERSQPQPPHTQGTLHRRLQPLCTAKHKVSCSGFLPKANPMQQSCSHYNAFCSITCLTRMSRHTTKRDASTDSKTPYNYEHMSNRTLQNAKGEPIRARNDRSRNRGTDKVPFIATCSHLARKKPRFRAPASSKKNHATFMWPLHNAFCSTTHAFMRTLHCDWHPHVAEHHGRTDYMLKR